MEGTKEQSQQSRKKVCLSGPNIVCQPYSDTKKTRVKAKATCKVVATTKVKTQKALRLPPNRALVSLHALFPFPSPNDWTGAQRCSVKFKARSISFNLVCGRRSDHNWLRPERRKLVCEANSSVLIHLRSGANPVGFDEHCDMIWLFFVFFLLGSCSHALFKICKKGPGWRL